MSTAVPRKCDRCGNNEVGMMASWNGKLLHTKCLIDECNDAYARLPVEERDEMRELEGGKMNDELETPEVCGVCGKTQIKGEMYTWDVDEKCYCPRCYEKKKNPPAMKEECPECALSEAVMHEMILPSMRELRAQNEGLKKLVLWAYGKITTEDAGRMDVYLRDIFLELRHEAELNDCEAAGRADAEREREISHFITEKKEEEKKDG